LVTFFDRAKVKIVIKAQTVSLFHQDKSIIERTPLEIQVEGIENGHRNTEKTLNKEYKKSKNENHKKFVALERICWRAYNGSYSTKMSTYKLQSLT
jgi:hypothetical protein